VNCGAIVPELQVKSEVGQLTSKQIGEKSGTPQLNKVRKGLTG
jgi:hypothetical protein